jgi:hypothetical protein
VLTGANGCALFEDRALRFPRIRGGRPRVGLENANLEMRVRFPPVAPAAHTTGATLRRATSSSAVSGRRVPGGAEVCGFESHHVNQKLRVWRNWQTHQALNLTSKRPRKSFLPGSTSLGTHAVASTAPKGAGGAPLPRSPRLPNRRAPFRISDGRRRGDRRHILAIWPGRFAAR